MKGCNRKVNLSHFFIQLPTDALGGKGRPFLTKLSEESYMAKIGYKYTSLGTQKVSEDHLDKDKL